MVRRRLALAAMMALPLAGCAGRGKPAPAPQLVQPATAITHAQAVGALADARSLASGRQYEVARARLQTVVPDAERWGWLDVLADAHFMIGEMYERERAARHGADAYARSFDASRRLGDTGRGLRALNALANALLDSGAYDKAAEVAREALRLAARDRALAAQATAQNNLGEAYRFSGRLGDARQAYVRALDLARQAGDGRAEVAVLFNLGITERRASRLEEARRHFMAARELAGRLNDSRAVTYAQWNLEQIEAELKRTPGAR